MVHLRAGHGFEHRHADMPRTADPPGTVRQAGALGLGSGNDVTHGFPGRVDWHHDKKVGSEQGRDRFEILRRVVGKLGNQMPQHRHMGVIHLHQGVPVGRGILDGIHRDHAIPTGTVFHNKGLTPVFGEFVTHQARNDFGTCPGGERRNQAHRLCRKLLRRHRQGGHAKRERKTRYEGAKLHEWYSPKWNGNRKKGRSACNP